jgi:hypothetical protein
MWHRSGLRRRERGSANPRQQLGRATLRSTRLGRVYFPRRHHAIALRVGMDGAREPMSSVRCAGSPPWVYGYDLHMKAAKRKSLRKSDFVYPPGSRIGGSQGRYPIDTKKRARAALRYSARADTAGTYKPVSHKVYQRYPSLSTS